MNATLNDQPFFMWIIVNAIYEVHSLYSHVSLDYIFSLDEHCWKNNYLSTGGKYCFTIHTNFAGSWLESEDICKNNNGDLWKPDNQNNWYEVRRSFKGRWYLANDRQWKVFDYDGHINALKLLHSSSLMYLKLAGNDQQVNIGFLFALFYFVFVASVWMRDFSVTFAEV